VALYATAATLEVYLGRPLSDAETDGAAAATAAATDFIDQYTGQTWQSATVTGEVHTLNGGVLVLDHAPMTAITAITGRAPYVGATVRAWAAGTDYDLIDAAGGVLLTNQADGTIVTVSYTRPATVPPSILQAANIIAAGYLVGAASFDSRTAGLTELSAGSVTLKWQLSSDAAAAVPAEAKALLAPYRALAWFA
jgi:hypothetical protein